LFESTAKPPKNSAMLRQFFAQAVVFSPRVRRRVLPPLHVLLCIPLFELRAKTTRNTINSATAGSAMSPLVTAQNVAFGRGFGGWI
jgi:hypothetical protein